MKLKINISPCPNDTFMFEALLHGRIDTEGLEFDVRFSDIEQLNAAVCSDVPACADRLGTPHDNPEISKISYAVLPRIAGHYRVLDSGSALGRGNGPLLVCRGEDTERLSALLHSRGECAPDHMDGEMTGALRCASPGCNRNPEGVCGADPMVADAVSGKDASCPGVSPDDFCVAVPGEHTTANLLLKRLFPRVTRKESLLFSEIAPAVAQGRFDAGVLIHEGRFTYAALGLGLLADLGQEWERATGLPLPLGAIVVSAGLPEDVRRKIDRVLRRSVAYAMDHPDASSEFVRDHAREMDPEVMRSHIGLFVNDHSLSLGAEGRRAVSELTGLSGKGLFVDEETESDGK